jgi:ATP-dependent Clp protease adaptor protein ClpS
MCSSTIKPQSETRSQQKSKQPWLWNVVLLNDDAHTVEFVVAMMKELFAHPELKGELIAKTVDKDGRAIVLTTHKEHAEFKQDQIHAFGRDKLVAECVGSMSAIIEPAEFGGEDDSAGTGDTGGKGSSGHA